MKVVKCRCNSLPSHFQTHKAGPNCGRWFYTCKKCKFFKWDDETERDTNLMSNDGQNNNTFNNNNNISNNNNNQFQLISDLNKKYGYKGNQNNNNNNIFSIQNRNNNNSKEDRKRKLPWDNNNPKPNKNLRLSSIHLSLTIYNENEISIHVAKSNIPKIQLYFSSMEQSHYSPQELCWIVPLSQYKTILIDAEEGKIIPGFSVNVEKIPDFVLNVFSSNYTNSIHKNTTNENIAKLMEERIPKQLLSKLMRFQYMGIREAILKNGRVFLCDEMGLGKTIQALAICSYYKNDWPCLIICPSSLRLTWASEIHKWLNIDEEYIQIIFSTKDIIKSSSKIVIVSYDLISRKGMSDQIKNKFNVVVADESHYIKNRDAKRTKIICPIIKDSKYALLLTGTPALSRPIELYTQLNSLIPRAISNPIKFAERYCDAKKTSFGWDFNGSSNLSELKLLLEKTVMIRRLKKDVLLELPPKVRQCIMIEVPKKSLKELNKLMSESKELDVSINKLRYQNNETTKQKLELQKKALLVKLYSETARAKIPSVQEYIDELYNNSDKNFIVFAHHQELLNGITEYVEKKLKAQYIRIDGETKQNNRQLFCENFQTNPNIRIAILAITAAGVGLTLNKADLVIFAELFWNPAQLLQGEDRAHRIGRVGSVDIKYLIANGTIDDMQWPLIQKKLDIIGATIDGKNDIISMSTTGKDTTRISSGSKKKGEKQMKFDDYHNKNDNTNQNYQKFSYDNINNNTNNNIDVVNNNNDSKNQNNNNESKNQNNNNNSNIKKDDDDKFDYADYFESFDTLDNMITNNFFKNLNESSDISSNLNNKNNNNNNGNINNTKNDNNNENRYETIDSTNTTRNNLLINKPSTKKYDLSQFSFKASRNNKNTNELWKNPCAFDLLLEDEIEVEKQKVIKENQSFVNKNTKNDKLMTNIDSNNSKQKNYSITNMTNQVNNSDDINDDDLFDTFDDQIFLNNPDNIKSIVDFDNLDILINNSTMTSDTTTTTNTVTNTDTNLNKNLNPNINNYPNININNNTNISYSNVTKNIGTNTKINDNSNNDGNKNINIDNSVNEYDFDDEFGEFDDNILDDILIKYNKS